jgi:hypothetical protein
MLGLDPKLRLAQNHPTFTERGTRTPRSLEYASFCYISYERRNHVVNVLINITVNDSSASVPLARKRRTNTAVRSRTLQARRALKQRSQKAAVRF